MLKTWHWPHSPAAAAEQWRAAMDRHLLPMHRANSSKPATTGLLLWTHTETDRRRRADTVPLHRPRPCLVSYVGSTNKDISLKLYCNLSTSADTLLFTIRYDTRCYFNARSKADTSQLNLPHGTDN